MQRELPNQHMNRPGPLEKVMVIASDADFCSRMHSVIEDAGYEPVIAGSSEAAIVLMQDVLPALVILAGEPDDATRHSCCRFVAQAPVIIVADGHDVEAIREAFDQGVTDFITRPVDWTLLTLRLQYILRTSRTMQQARTNERLLAEAQRIANLGNWAWDLSCDEIEVSDQSCRIFGVPRTSPGTFYHLFQSAIHDDDRAGFDRAIHQAVQGHPADIEFRIHVQGGQEKTLLMHAERSGPAGSSHLFGTLQNITERKKTEESIRRLAYFDTVTGLPNRTLFSEHLKAALAKASRNGTCVAVMFLDLDNFKRINDSLGHVAGDQLLKEVSVRLQQSIRSTDVAARESSDDTVARLGGDEFTVLLTDMADASHAGVVAERILDSLSKPLMLAGNRVSITSSIGIAIYPDDGHESDVLLKHADAAMYQVKYKGRNGVFFYDDELRRRSQDRIHLEGELVKALERDEMTLFYQPKIDANSSTVSGFEALIRWIHPERGMVSPIDFIPVAEDSGLIVPMGKWVIRTACRQHVAWLKAGLPPVNISVNLSCHQFADHHLLASIEQILAETGVDPAYLEFEITESVLMKDAEAALQVLSEMKAMGLKLSVDDFGTGYSSMSYLKHFPIDVLKIDRSFVLDITTDEQDATITSAIISLAGALGLAVVAEGVETREQLDFLRQCNCDQVQGYLFSPPVPADRAVHLITKQF
ncbi:EAL domain-containing protein [Mariprofundus erugo]|uniref:EAL domain-containing protein n=1 Tax=Mariprofundus erugo TaxID=2528639 RepID=A0A5R9GSM6_9PROT|nr:EAL domain-containing protein [Mariprofundus erugo]TLS68608.1 EAL domain-containing protein [Mariprofundus erugo]